MCRMRSIILLLIWLLGIATPAGAITVLGLNDLGCHNQTHCTLQLEGNGVFGVTATFSSPDVTLGTSDFYAYEGGMIFGSRVFPHSFDLTFNRTLHWNGGVVGLSHRFDGFQISGTGLSSTSILAEQQVGAFSLATPITFLADQSYRFSGQPSTHFGVAVLSEMRFAPVVSAAAPSVVPLPATLPMMLAFLACLGALGLRNPGWPSLDHRNRCPDHAVA